MIFFIMDLFGKKDETVTQPTYEDFPPTEVDNEWSMEGVVFPSFFKRESFFLKEKGKEVKIFKTFSFKEDIEMREAAGTVIKEGWKLGTYADLEAFRMLNDKKKLENTQPVVSFDQIIPLRPYGYRGILVPCLKVKDGTYQEMVFEYFVWGANWTILGSKNVSLLEKQETIKL